MNGIISVNFVVRKRYNITIKNRIIWNCARKKIKVYIQQFICNFVYHKTLHFRYKIFYLFYRKKWRNIITTYNKQFFLKNCVLVVVCLYVCTYVFILSLVVRAYRVRDTRSCTVLYCTVLHCTVLYCTVLYCTILYCTYSVIVPRNRIFCPSKPLWEEPFYTYFGTELSLAPVSILMVSSVSTGYNVRGVSTRSNVRVSAGCTVHVVSTVCKVHGYWEIPFWPLLGILTYRETAKTQPNPTEFR